MLKQGKIFYHNLYWWICQSEGPVFLPAFLAIVTTFYGARLRPSAKFTKRANQDKNLAGGNEINVFKKRILLKGERSR